MDLEPLVVASDHCLHYRSVHSITFVELQDSPEQRRICPQKRYRGPSVGIWGVGRVVRGGVYVEGGRERVGKRKFVSGWGGKGRKQGADGMKRQPEQTSMRTSGHRDDRQRNWEGVGG